MWPTVPLRPAPLFKENPIAPLTRGHLAHVLLLFRWIIGGSSREGRWIHEIDLCSDVVSVLLDPGCSSSLPHSATEGFLYAGSNSWGALI